MSERVDTEIVTGMGPVEIVAEFRKGCVDTQIGRRAPETCTECLQNAVRVMTRHGFTEAEAVALLSAADAKEITDA